MAGHGVGGDKPAHPRAFGGKEPSPSRCDAPGLGDLQLEGFWGLEVGQSWVGKGSGAKDGERWVRSRSQEPPYHLLPATARARAGDGKGVILTGRRGERGQGWSRGGGSHRPGRGTRGGDEPRREQRCVFPGASHRDQQPLALLGAEPEASGAFPSPATFYFLRQPLAASPIMSQYSPNSSLASSGFPMHSIFSSSGPTHCRGGRKTSG